MRDTLANWVTLGVILLIVTAYFAWPGFLSTPAHPPECNPSLNENETVFGHTYCITPLGVPRGQCINYTAPPVQPVNWTSFLGFTFGLGQAAGGRCAPEVITLNLTVIDPYGPTYHGSMSFGGLLFPGVWIAPDNESGFDFRGNYPVVMVAAGS